MINENYFPGMLDFVNNTLDDNKSNAKKFTDIFSATINIFELSLQIFMISTIRIYEDRLTDESDLFIKKTKPINGILRDQYVAPSLGAQAALAKACIHLIDDAAPAGLRLRKEKLTDPILLG